MSQITYRSNSTTRMIATKSFDFLNRILQVSNAPSADAAASFDYVYNDANERVRRTDSDGRYLIYRYDSLGQITSGMRYWQDGTPVAGQQFEFIHDDIGYRVTSIVGVDAKEANR